MPTFEELANAATAIAALLLAWQVFLARKAFIAQSKSMQLEAFSSMTLKFLDLIENFGEHINDPETGESDLTPEERRAIDRYFYLASMEYSLYKERFIDEKLSSQWIRGIASAAKSRPFAERWESTASKFTLDEDFRKYFESHLEK